MKAHVLLPKIFNHPFTYNCNKKTFKIGDFVEVPFGKSQEVGVIWPGKNLDLKNIKIKNISKKIDNISLDKHLIDFINWFASYNMMPLGLVLKMAIGKDLNLAKKRIKIFYKIKQAL